MHLHPKIKIKMRNACCNNKDRKNKGPWSKQEDQKLVDYNKLHGHGCWHALPRAAGLDRCGKSCRLRWTNYLRADIKRGTFSEDEEDLIIKLHALLGNRWSLIAGRLPGRTDNEVKNYWNSHIRRKLICMGIDPNNHKIYHHHHHHHHQHNHHQKLQVPAFINSSEAKKINDDAYSYSSNATSKSNDNPDGANANDHAMYEDANAIVRCIHEVTSSSMLDLNLKLPVDLP